jgi:hypothetical protein
MQGYTATDVVYGNICTFSDFFTNLLAISLNEASH